MQSIFINDATSASLSLRTSQTPANLKIWVRRSTSSQEIIQAQSIQQEKKLQGKLIWSARTINNKAGSAWVQEHNHSIPCGRRVSLNSASINSEINFNRVFCSPFDITSYNFQKKKPKKQAFWYSQSFSKILFYQKGNLFPSRQHIYQPFIP